MSAVATLAELSAKGIWLRIDGKEIKLSAPQGIVTPEILADLRDQKPALLRALVEIKTVAGDDWQEISGDPEKLRAFADMLSITAMRERGEAPLHYTMTTTCRRCGPVPIFEGCPPRVDGCPWCHNRIRGLPRPRP